MPARPAPFPTWHLALAAVPESREEVDWWARPGDGRHPRYERLRRGWGDSSDVGANALPPQFYRPHCEKHLVACLWENLSLFAPADAVERLYAALGWPDGGGATDLCWGYEFQTGHGDRHLDLVLHARFGDRDEVVIGEAKAGRKAFDGKDRDSRGAKGRPQFAFADARRYFLLGDAAAPDDWAERGNGRLTWAGLAALQATLCDALPEPPERRALVADLIAAQFAAHGIAPAGGSAAPPLDALGERVAAADGGWSTPRCARFAAMAVRHLGHLAGRPAPPAAGLPRRRTGRGGHRPRLGPRLRRPGRQHGRVLAAARPAELTATGSARVQNRRACGRVDRGDRTRRPHVPLRLRVIGRSGRHPPSGAVPPSPQR